MFNLEALVVYNSDIRVKASNSLKDKQEQLLPTAAKLFEIISWTHGKKLLKEREVKGSVMMG